MFGKWWVSDGPPQRFLHYEIVREKVDDTFARRRHPALG
jgi:hypothetical protein